MLNMKPLELSEIRGLRVKCTKCQWEHEFLFPLQEPIATVHMCPSPETLVRPGSGTVIEAVAMDDIATTAKTIQAGGTGRLEMSFLVA